MSHHRETCLCTPTGDRVPVHRLRPGDQLLTWSQTAYDFISAKVTEVKRMRPLTANEHWVHVTALAPGSSNGRAGFAVTGDHRVVTKHGPVYAAELQPGDQLLSWYTKRIKPDSRLDQVITGLCLAGAGLARLGSSSGMCMLTWMDKHRPTLAAWFGQALACLGTKTVHAGTGDRWQTAKSTELDAVYRERFTVTEPGSRVRRVIPAGLTATPLTTAVWLSWVGHVGTGGLTLRLPGDPASAVNAVDALLAGDLGLTAADVHVTTDCRAVMTSPTVGDRLLDRVAVYMHPAAGETLLPPGLRSRWSPPVMPKQLPPGQRVPRWTPVITVGRGSARLARTSMWAYTVTVDQPDVQVIAGGEHGVVV